MSHHTSLRTGEQTIMLTDKQPPGHLPDPTPTLRSSTLTLMNISLRTSQSKRSDIVDTFEVCVYNRTL